MKIVITRCPSCKAELIAESGQRTVYCAYCGKNVPVDYKAGRTGSDEYPGMVSSDSSTYPKMGTEAVRKAQAQYRDSAAVRKAQAQYRESAAVREAKAQYKESAAVREAKAHKKGNAAVREAQARYKENAAKFQKHVAGTGKYSPAGKKSPYRILLILLILIPFVIAIVTIASSIASEKMYVRTTKEQTAQVCDEHGASILYFDEEEDTFYINIITKDAWRNHIDAIQDELLQKITIKDGWEAWITFNDSKNQGGRSVCANSDGSVDIVEDSTTVLSQDAIRKMADALKAGPGLSGGDL